MLLVTEGICRATLAYYETRRAEEMRECTTWVNDSEAVHKQEPFIDTLEGLAGRQVTLYTNGLHSAELAVKNGNRRCTALKTDRLTVPAAMFIIRFNVVR